MLVSCTTNTNNPNWRQQHQEEWKRKVLPTLPKMVDESVWKEAAKRVCDDKAKVSVSTTRLNTISVGPKYCPDESTIWGDNYSYVVFGLIDPQSGEFLERAYAPFNIISYKCIMMYLGGDKYSQGSWDIWDYSIDFVDCDLP